MSEDLRHLNIISYELKCSKCKEVWRLTETHYLSEQEISEYQCPFCNKDDICMKLAIDHGYMGIHNPMLDQCIFLLPGFFTGRCGKGVNGESRYCEEHQIACSDCGKQAVAFCSYFFRKDEEGIGTCNKPVCNECRHHK